MEDLPIFIAAKKIFPENYDLHHYLNVLFEHPENEWFAPNNSDNDAYSICEELGAVHLLCMKRKPLWINGSFRGVKTYIFYNKNLFFEAEHSTLF